MLEIESQQKISGARLQCYKYLVSPFKFKGGIQHHYTSGFFSEERITVFRFIRGPTNSLGSCCFDMCGLRSDASQLDNFKLANED